MDIIGPCDLPIAPMNLVARRGGLNVNLTQRRKEK